MSEEQIGIDIDQTDGSYEAYTLTHGKDNGDNGTFEQFKSAFSIPNVPILHSTFSKYNDKAKWLDYFSKNEIPFIDTVLTENCIAVYEICGLQGVTKNEFPILSVDIVLRDEIYINRLNDEGEYIFEEKEDGYLYPVVDAIPQYNPFKMWFKSIEELEEVNFAEKFHACFGLEEYAVEEEEENE